MKQEQSWIEAFDKKFCHKFQLEGNCIYEGGIILTQDKSDDIKNFIKDLEQKVRTETIEEMREFLEESSVWDSDYIYIRKVRALEQFDDKFGSILALNKSKEEK